MKNGLSLVLLLVTAASAQAQDKEDFETLFELSVASQNARAKLEVSPDKKASEVGFAPEIVEEEMKVIDRSLKTLVEKGVFIERYVVVPFPKDLREWDEAMKKEFETLLSGLDRLAGEIGLKYGHYAAKEMCDLSRVRTFGHFTPEGGCPFRVRVPKEFGPQVNRLMKKFGFKQAPESRGIVKIEIGEKSTGDQSEQ